MMIGQQQVLEDTGIVTQVNYLLTIYSYFVLEVLHLQTSQISVEDLKYYVTTLY